MSTRDQSTEVELSVGVDPASEVLFEHFRGRLTSASLLEAFRNPKFRDLYRPGIKILTDFTDSVLELRYKEMRGFILEMEALLSSAGGTHGQAAIVAKRDVSFGTSRMYEILAEETSSPSIGVFRDLDAAAAWLEVSREVIDSARSRAVTIKLLPD